MAVLTEKLPSKMMNEGHDTDDVVRQRTIGGCDVLVTAEIKMIAKREEISGERRWDG